MSPWKPVPGWGQFQNERRMPDAEVEALVAWVRAGGAATVAGAGAPP